MAAQQEILDQINRHRERHGASRRFFSASTAPNRVTLTGSPTGGLMNDRITYLITWTTYGTWLPGDARGWRKADQGPRQPQPLLEEWCRTRLAENPVLLNEAQRLRVESVCRKHAEIRGWELHAVSVRSNHVHLVVTADKPAKIVRDQFKANATRVLREPPDAVTNESIWTKGGDCEVVDGEESLHRVLEYVTEAQDRKHRD